MSSPTSEDDAIGLVVPVDVVALCVGERDAAEATGEFAGPTAVFTRQVTREREAFIGANVDRDFDTKPTPQLGVGVHLHWALPDGLTRAVATREALDFPAVPSRWLVTRIAIGADGGASARSWLVESDVVHETRPPGQSPITIPTSTAVTGAADARGGLLLSGVREESSSFGYLGRWLALDGEDAGTPAPAGGRPLREVAGTELTAVANGEVGFAAYYPACSSVFGFHDRLDDLPPSPARAVQLTYSVVGWYDEPDLDPVNAATTPEQLRETYGWSCDPAGGAPLFSVYEGQVQAIAWDRARTYVIGSPAREPLHVEAALGNTPAEALAAHFAAADRPGKPLFESLLTAFQLGLLDAFGEPRADQLTQLAEGLHDSAFASATTRALHAIVPADPDGPAIPLTPELGEALNRLNALAEAADLLDAEAGWTRWNLFADWYRIFEAGDTRTRNAAALVAYARLAGWPELAARRDEARRAAAAQRDVVLGLLPEGLVLGESPAARFHQPADPVVMLCGEGVELPPRHGGDGRFDDDRTLVCRTTDRLLRAVTVDGTEIAADRFAAVAAPPAVRRSALATALMREACLLDTRIAAALAGVEEPVVRAALETALAGERQELWAFDGERPSAVTVNWYRTGVWLPLFAAWEADWLPLHPTAAHGRPSPYPPEVFGGNFVVDQDAGGAIRYRPQREGGIVVDPAQPSYPQRYGGSATLSPTAPETLARLLSDYLDVHEDATLRRIREQLGAAEFVTTPLAGLTDLLTMRRTTLQLDVAVPPGSDYEELTLDAKPVIGRANTIGPDFNGDYNGFRAGWMRVGLRLVDAFGQKRRVEFPQLTVAAPMETRVDDRPVPSTAYLAPRIAQRCRLLLRWLTPGAEAVEQALTPPPIDPVCGWLVPNHLDGSLFLYDASGRALGTLYLDHDSDGPPVGWFSAPGDARTIDEPIEEALRFADPQLRALAFRLVRSSRDFFIAFWRSLDTVASNVDPAPLSSDSGLVTLVGRPIAVAQAAVRLELDGRPARDVSWRALADEDDDEGLGELELPVVLGDFRRLGDGLIGFFKASDEEDDGYDLATFYTQGAPDSGGDGVRRPQQGTVTVRPTPTLTDPPGPSPERTERLLLLVDPRGPVHATSGWLPTATLALDPDQANGALTTLDLSFLTAPVLRGDGGLALPVPQEAGYQTSWIEVVHGQGGALTWSVTPEIEQPAGRAVWPYTPQQVAEGWLRLNPILLAFDLLDAEHKPIVVAGRSNDLTLHVVNRARRTIAFEPGTPVPEGSAPNGSVVSMQLGGLVAQSDVPQIELSAPGWTFQCFDDPRIGRYWSAAPTTRVTLAPEGHLEISVRRLFVVPTATEGRAYFGYAAVSGLNDGVYADALTVQVPVQPHS